MSDVSNTSYTPPAEPATQAATQPAAEAPAEAYPVPSEAAPQPQDATPASASDQPATVDEAPDATPAPTKVKAGDVVRYRYSDPRGDQEAVGQVLDVLHEDGQPDRVVLGWFSGVSGPLHADDVETL